MSVAELENVAKAWPPISRAVRVPHTEADYRDLVELLDRITDEVGEDENHPLASLMDVLGVLIEKYEDEHVPELAEQTDFRSPITNHYFPAPLALRPPYRGKSSFYAAFFFATAFLATMTSGNCTTWGTGSVPF